MKTLLPFILSIVLGSAFAQAAPDTLVVCPEEFRAALAPWEEYRKVQGHELVFAGVPRDAAELRADIRAAAAQQNLQYLVLVGDVPTRSMTPEARRLAIPTNYLPAKINVTWGSEPTIASDVQYSDIDGDGAPDLAVGRIPVDSAEQLAAVVRKIIQYETQAGPVAWDRQLAALAGTGDFGTVADALIEAAGQQIMQKALPPGYVVDLNRAKTGPREFGPFAAPKLGTVATASAPLPEGCRQLQQQLSDGCLLWVYLGHAQPTTLDYVAGQDGPVPLLSVEDVPSLHCGGRCPLALLVACYAGACDASSDGLAEKLLLAEEGPVSVIGATRVSMPYGNTILAYEFLRSSLIDRTATLGAALLLAQQRTLAAGDGDAMRKSLDDMAKGLGPILHRGKEPWRPENLAEERREHVALYQLLGDPLTVWRRPQKLSISTTSAELVAGRELSVEGQADFGGKCLVELARVGTTAGSKENVHGDDSVAVSQDVPAGKFQIALSVPDGASGQYTVRVYLQNEKQSAVGGTNVTVRPARNAAK